MPDTKQEQLIIDTLHYRSSGESCFVVNEPGLRLIASDPSFLPPIKATLLKLAQHKKQQEPRGLGYVIGAFLVLGTKHAPETIVPFILSLPPAFQKEVLKSVPSWFQKNKRTGKYNFSVAPTRELIEFVRQLSLTAAPDLRKVAERVLKFIAPDDYDDSKG